ncbi:hypothetical protein LCGC14_0938110 [marine sediment metagenome]|uniref:Uncharacterized protein n=1 Tax=marine sediment metagenome TaxID=412755 RepID=A0A0F9NKY2_9ZZZZ|nr:hypothetical protein [bacterium]
MRLKLLLNIENFQNHTIYTAEHSDIKDCYREQVIFLQDWVAYTPFAGKLLTHILKILGEIPIEGGQLKAEEDATPEFKYVETENEPVKKTSGLDFERTYKMGKDPCNKCGGQISWALRPGRSYPLHVDLNGKIEDNGRNGDCPKSGF